jgi:hypothetical protein
VGIVDILLDNITCDNLIDISFFVQLSVYLFHGGDLLVYALLNILLIN